MADSVHRSKPRTRRYSFVLSRKFDDHALDFLRVSFSDYNKRELRNNEQKCDVGSRYASFYIEELRCVSGDGDTTRCLLHTNGSQFQFTRWNQMLNQVLGFVERMDPDSKVKQIAEFTNLMKVVDAKSIIRFETPRNTPKKHGLADAEFAPQPPTKQLALAICDRPSPRSAPSGSLHSAGMQQTVLTGVVSRPSSVKASLSFGGEPGPSQQRGDDGVLSLESLLTPSGDALEKLCNFLIGKHDVYKSTKAVEGRKEGESADEFRSRMRKQVNVTPVLVKVIMKFLPPFLASNKHCGVTDTELPAGHVDLLVSLQRMFYPVVSWKGVYALYLTPDSQELSYGIDCSGKMSQKSCYLELWRRALNLEGGLAALVAYLMKIIECVPTPALTTVSPQTLGNVRVLLSSGAGLYGGGSTFWNPRSVDCMQKLKEGGDSKVKETVQSLINDRAGAFSAIFPFADELCLLPTVAHIATIGQDLANLLDLSTAQKVETSLSSDYKSRMELYKLCCDHMCLYGGRLTW